MHDHQHVYTSVLRKVQFYIQMGSMNHEPVGRYQPGMILDTL